MYEYIEATGVIVPDTAAIQTEVQTEFQTALGTDFSLQASAPQGVLITGEVSARSVFLQNNAALANQINPNKSGGVFLDAVCALTDTYRTAQTYSTAVLNVTGVAGTVIPPGSLVADSLGDQFASTGVITLNGSGLGSGTFQCQVAGPIAADINTITQIVDGVIGWETATNPAAAVPGAFVQSDPSLKNERVSVLNPSTPAVPYYKAVLAVQNVTSMTFRENDDDTTEVIDGITMLPNSVYLCVAGGVDQDVGDAIMSAKGSGVKFNNGASSDPISTTYTDPYSGQPYTILFDRPDTILILIKVYYRLSSATEDPTDAITEAILSYQAGDTNAPAGFTVGGIISAFEIAAVINQIAAPLFVTSVTTAISSGSPVYSTDPLSFEQWELPYTNETAIVVIGV